MTALPRRVRVARALAGLVLGAFFALSPIPRQVFGVEGRGWPGWSMFSNASSDVCVASYRSAADGSLIGHHAVLEPRKDLNFPRSGRLGEGDRFEARTRAICLENPSVTDITVRLLCPGRHRRTERREDVCEATP